MLSLGRCLRRAEEVICSGNLIFNRNYQSKSRSRSRSQSVVHPVEIKSRSKEKQYSDDLQTGDVDVAKIKQEFRQEVRHEFRTRGDVAEEDVEILHDEGFGYNEMQREHLRLQSKTRRSKMFRKHFAEYIDNKEVSVLTYAEKEKIRYLHTSNPQEWTPEALSGAFPVSPEGALKIIKSSFRARSIKEIRDHDQMVADRIQQIKQGEIEMTPDLEEKMNMRNSQPLHIGALDPYDKNMLLKFYTSKPMGEFQSLVATPRKKHGQPPTLSLASGVPSNTSVTTPQKEPDLGDSFTLEPTIQSRKDLKNVSGNRRMTFTEFQSKLKITKKSSPDVKYIAKLQPKTETQPVSLTDFEKQEDDEVADKIVNFSIISKFKESEQEIHTHHKSLAERDESCDRIYIPPDQVKEGAVYRQGNTFYDEKGEFLYRVV